MSHLSKRYVPFVADYHANQWTIQPSPLGSGFIPHAVLSHCAVDIAWLYYRTMRHAISTNGAAASAA